MPAPIKRVEKGNVVMELELNGGKVYFCDDCCRNMTKEDVDKILQRTADEMLPRLRAQYERNLRRNAVSE